MYGSDDKPSSPNETKKEDDAFDLDDLLPIVGEFGKYQKQLLWFVCLPACLPCGFCAFNQLFMASTPPHWCRVPGLEAFDSTRRRRLGIPATHQENNETVYSQCTRYDINWTDPNIVDLSNGDLETVNFTNWPVIPCDHGWEYDMSEIVSSIVIDRIIRATKKNEGTRGVSPLLFGDRGGETLLFLENFSFSGISLVLLMLATNGVDLKWKFDLVCDKAIYPTLGLVALNSGGPIGVYLFGTLNDRIGRRLSFFSCLTTLIIGGIITSLSNDFWTWAACRVVVGLTIPAIYQIPFIISLELVGPNYRSFVTVMTCTFYTMGLCMLAGVTYLIPEWRTLALVTSTPFLGYILYWWFLPESPRWLLAKGRLSEASDILQTLAKVNGKELPASFTQKLKQRMTMSRTKSEEERLKNGPGVLSLFKTPNMRLKTCLITLNWFANNMVYVGLSYYGPALGNEEHLSFFFSSLAEIPSYLACWMVMDRWGRRWPLCLCMVTAGLSCVATVLLPSDAVITTLILFLLSKSAISASFLIIYPFAGELYPTQLRGVAIGFSAYISGLGLIIIPFITYLGKENLVLPLVILGAVSVIGGLSGLRLPETLHHRLPQTVEEGELFGKDWKCADCLRCVPIKPPSASTSYEDLSAGETVEMQSVPTQPPMEEPRGPPTATRRLLMRQSSVMDTQRDSDGSIKMTYWF